MGVNSLKFAERTRHGVSYFVVESWEKQGVPHGFLDRSLDLGKAGWQTAWRDFSNQELKLLKQEHGTTINHPQAGVDCPRGDGWIVGDSAVLCGIKSADCVPLLIFDPRSKQRAALHCGWRPTVSGIVELAVSQFLASDSEISDLEIAIGPGARSCCYEVGQEVVDKICELPIFEALDFEELTSEVRSPHAIFRNDREKIFLDLPTLLSFQLLALGVTADNIGMLPHCTICSERFFSFRREKEQAGRQLSFI